jgi:hypothetical protein
MRSEGTRETQGINGDAAAYSRQLDTIARYVTGPGSVCPYPSHRDTDWLKTDVGIVYCGVCHPPAIPPALITRRGEPDFTRRERRIRDRPRRSVPDGIL